MSDKEVMEKIREMAKLTIMSSRINEIQEQNLKMYPLVFFEGVKSVKIEYDFSHKKTVNDEPVIANSLISYYVELDESKNDHLPTRFLMLEGSVRNLFWKDTTVEIYFNDKIVYKSKKSIGE